MRTWYKPGAYEPDTSENLLTRHSISYNTRCQSCSEKGEILIHFLGKWPTLVKGTKRTLDKRIFEDIFNCMVRTP